MYTPKFFTGGFFWWRKYDKQDQQGKAAFNECNDKDTFCFSFVLKGELKDGAKSESFNTS
jgi:hypothetical protein